MLRRWYIKASHGNMFISCSVSFEEHRALKSHWLWNWNHPFGQKRWLVVRWGYSSLTCHMVSSCFGGMVKELSWDQTQRPWSKAYRGCPWILNRLWSRHFYSTLPQFVNRNGMTMLSSWCASRGGCGKGFNEKKLWELVPRCGFHFLVQAFAKVCELLHPKKGLAHPLRPAELLLIGQWQWF